MAVYEVSCLHREHVRLPLAPDSPSPQIPTTGPRSGTKHKCVKHLPTLDTLSRKQNWNRRQATICAWQSPSLGWGGAAPSRRERAGGSCAACLEWSGVDGVPGFSDLFQKFPYFIPVVFNMKL